MKNREALQFLHDRLHDVLHGQTPLRLAPFDVMVIGAYLDLLCWMLGHEHNRRFELSMAELRSKLLDAGAMTVVDPLTWPQCQTLRAMGERFIIVRRHPESPRIQCLTCGLVSANPGDVANRYCGHCKIFHLDATAEDLQALRLAVQQATTEAK